MSKHIQLHPEDNVALAFDDFEAGQTMSAIKAVEPIPAGHKMALRDLASGAPIRKYNQIIGFASQPILAGAHVHVHNTEMRSFDRDYAFGADVKDFDPVPTPATFKGYVRTDGRVGTRNYLAVLTSVNCSATVARYIADAFRDEEVQAQFPNVDGVVSFTHSTGCSMNIEGEGLRVLRRVIAGYAQHPNVAAALIVGLGCEVNQIPDLMDAHGLTSGPNLRTMTIQETGGTKATVDRGVAMIKEMLSEANQATRTTVPASYLTLGLECGGSDSYSGITANPSLGAAADLLVLNGGTAVLSETPEIYGAEHLLTRRAVSREVGEKLINLIRWWEDYTARNGGEMDNNPTPGNKAGGLTTILEKSLGAVAKGGTMNLSEVFNYAERITAKGFVFMDSPGYDPVSITGQVASGANIVCFTTGRGSVYGCKPAPSLKLATNSPMYHHMSEDMDVNCGEILDGTTTVQEQGEQIFQLILDTASGASSKSEALGFGDNEFTPWQLGAVM
ncbi:MAG: altronate dehydratase family protein [SAR324 cluster bacterium]|jgi:altronate hydrolase|nr:altronate dehydratase family protein [SAR324 cluster bacterium]